MCSRAACGTRSLLKLSPRPEFQSHGAALPTEGHTARWKWDSGAKSVLMMAAEDALTESKENLRAAQLMLTINQAHTTNNLQTSVCGCSVLLSLMKR